MDIAFEVTKLIKFSPKRNAIFDKIKEENAAEDDSGVAGHFVVPDGRINWKYIGELQRSE